MEFKGTKGVWKKQPCTEGTEIYSGGRAVARIPWSKITDTEALANISLIKCAPEMLEQLHSLAMMVLQSDFYKDCPDFKEQVDKSLELIKSATKIHA